MYANVPSKRNTSKAMLTEASTRSTTLRSTHRRIARNKNEERGSYRFVELAIEIIKLLLVIVGLDATLHETLVSGNVVINYNFYEILSLNVEHYPLLVGIVRDLGQS